MRPKYYIDTIDRLAKENQYNIAQRADKIDNILCKMVISLKSLEKDCSGSLQKGIEELKEKLLKIKVKNLNNEGEYEKLTDDVKTFLNSCVKFFSDNKEKLESGGVKTKNMKINKIPKFDIDFPFIEMMLKLLFHEKNISRGVCLGITAVFLEYFFADKMDELILLLIKAKKMYEQGELGKLATKSQFYLTEEEKQIKDLFIKIYTYMGYDHNNPLTNNPQNIFFTNKKIELESKQSNKAHNKIPQPTNSTFALFKTSEECEFVMTDLIKQLNKKFNRYALKIGLPTHSTTILVSKKPESEKSKYYCTNHNHQMVTYDPSEVIKDAISKYKKAKSMNVDGYLPVEIEILTNDVYDEKNNNPINFKQLEKTYQGQDNIDTMKKTIASMIDGNCKSSLGKLLESIINNNNLTNDQIKEILTEQYTSDKSKQYKKQLHQGIVSHQYSAIHEFTTQILNALKNKKFTINDVKDIFALKDIHYSLSKSDKKTVSAFYRAILEYMSENNSQDGIESLLDNEGVLFGEKILSDDLHSLACIDAVVNTNNMDLDDKIKLLGNNPLLKNINNITKDEIISIIDTICESENLTTSEKKTFINEFIKNGKSFKLLIEKVINLEIANTELTNSLIDDHIIQSKKYHIKDNKTLNKIISSDFIGEDIKIKLLFGYFDMDDNFTIDIDQQNKTLSNILNSNISFSNGIKPLLNKIGFEGLPKNTELLNTITQSKAPLSTKLGLILNKDIDENHAVFSDQFKSIEDHHDKIIEFINEISSLDFLNDDQKSDLIIKNTNILPSLLNYKDNKKEKPHKGKAIEIYENLIKINGFHNKAFTATAKKTNKNKLVDFLKGVEENGNNQP